MNEEKKKRKKKIRKDKKRKKRLRKSCISKKNITRLKHLLMGKNYKIRKIDKKG